jgi:hypothetical protein
MDSEIKFKFRELLKVVERETDAKTRRELEDFLESVCKRLDKLEGK